MLSVGEQVEVGTVSTRNSSIVAITIYFGVIREKLEKSPYIANQDENPSTHVVKKQVDLEFQQEIIIIMFEREDTESIVYLISYFIAALIAIVIVIAFVALIRFV